VAAAAAALLLVVTLTGCLRLDMDLTIESDTVNGTIVMAIDRQAAQLFGIGPDDMFDNPDDADFSTLSGVTTEPYEDDNWTGVQYLLHWVSLDELNALAGDDEEMPRIIHDPQAGTYEFLLTVDFTDFAFDDAMEDDGGDAFPGLNPAALQEMFDVRVTVTFPGEVTDHNGELTGTTVTWRPAPGELSELRAVSQEGSPGNGPAGLPGATSGVAVSALMIALLVGLGVLVLVIAAGVVIWLVRRKPAETPAASAPAAANPAADGEPATGGGPAAASP
jgi:hypothetical protein